MKDGTHLAAVDLGSNSFRLEIGRLEHGRIQRTEYLKETVRQGNGLDAERNLTPEAMQRGWDCLARFAERLAGFPRAQVRAVATQTLREARNREAFLERAHRILGFPIDVISGHEEARLIYQGVAHLLPQSDERRLVVDIGGRSTELILGSAYTPRRMESFRVGSVAWSMRFFPDGQLGEGAFDAAEVAAQAILDEAQDVFQAGAWDLAYGSSGTVGAVADILATTGTPVGTIDREALQGLRRTLIAARHVDRLRLDALKDDRKAVIAGGVSILCAVFDMLGIRQMHAANGALRHGVLYDLLDRQAAETDVRGATVDHLMRRFKVDAAQAQRVAAVARQLWSQSATQADDNGRLLRKLEWAARLHEIGSIVAHEDHHKHGAYLLDHVDAAGFAQPELHRLSQLVLGHRGKLRKLDVDWEDAAFVHQLLCLRLAVILCHARRAPDLNGIDLTQVDVRTYRLRLGTAWADRFPQSNHLLREECTSWSKTPWTLTIDTRG